MAFYPMWCMKFARDEARMRVRWPAARGAGWEAEIEQVLRHIADHGPASSLDVGGDGKKGSSGRWDWHPSKTALEFLWRSGQLAICHRRGFRKFYDLPERVDVSAREDCPQPVRWRAACRLSPSCRAALPA